MALGWHNQADEVERLPLALDPDIIEANDAVALQRYQWIDGDPTRLVVPSSATIVELRVLGVRAADLARTVKGDRGQTIPKPALGQRVLADVQRRVSERVPVDVDAIRVGRQVMAAAVDALAVTADLHDVHLAVGRSLNATVGGDEEEQAETIGVAALGRVRAAVQAQEIASLSADDAAALAELNAWEIASQDSFLAAVVVAIEEGGRRVEFTETHTVLDWLDTLKPASFVRMVRQELLIHAGRVTELGKAEKRRWSQPSTPLSTTGKGSPLGAATGATVSGVDPAATAEAAFAQGATG